MIALRCIGKGSMNHAPDWAFALLPAVIAAGSITTIMLCAEGRVSTRSSAQSC